MAGINTVVKNWNNLCHCRRTRPRGLLLHVSHVPSSMWLHLCRVYQWAWQNGRTDRWRVDAVWEGGQTRVGPRNHGSDGVALWCYLANTISDSRAAAMRPRVKLLRPFVRFCLTIYWHKIHNMHLCLSTTRAVNVLCLDENVKHLWLAQLSRTTGQWRSHTSGVRCVRTPCQDPFLVYAIICPRLSDTPLTVRTIMCPRD